MSALADALLVLHVGVVVFVVLGEVLFVLGGWRGWQWVRNRPLRLSHLGLIVFVAVQAWLQQTCPLTSWERALRPMSEQASSEVGFIQYWLSRLLYIEAPPWVFTAAYSLFAAAVIATWFVVPPQWRRMQA
jgi:hypothetical protein